MEQGGGEGENEDDRKAVVNGDADSEHYETGSEGDSDDMATNFDREDKADPADVYAKTAHIRVDFNRNNVHFFFIQLEMLLESAECGSQWMKRLVLQRSLPSTVVEDLQDIFSKGKVQAGATAYIDAKTRILELYAPRAEDKWKKAKDMLLLDEKPSQLCRKLIQVLCPKHPTMVDCCAEPIISGMWRDQLPPLVKAAVANLTLGNGKLDDTLRVADTAHAATKSGAAVAAVEEEEIAAFRRQQPQQKKKPKPQGQQAGQKSGQKGSQRQGGTQQKGRGDPHPDGPPESACQIHWQWGKSAYYCKKPHSCPWQSFTTPPPNK